MESTTEEARRIINSAVELFTEQRQISQETQYGFSWPGSWNSIGADTDAEYVKVKKNFRVTQTVEQILRQMLSSATSAMEKLKGDFNTMTNKRVLHTLPDEILVIILEHCCGRRSGLNYEAISKFLLVSRHFRDIVLGIPSVWCHLPQLHLERAERYASRATMPEIEMTIRGILYSSERETRRVPGMYNLAVSISSRIQTLTLTLSKSDLPHLETLLQTCSSMNLPFLEDFDLSCSDVGHQCRSICSNWDMPSLRKLGIWNVLPVLASSVLSQIKACTVAANWGKQVEDIESLGTSEVVEFLVSLTSVEDLRVDVHLLAEYQGDDSENISMGSVKKLTLCLQNLESTQTQVVMGIIKFPSILAFNIELGLPDIVALDEALEAVSSSWVFEESVESITHFQLSLSTENGDSLNEPFEVINDWCARFEGLRSITVESKREKGHGLLSFASSIDAVRVFSGDEPMPEGSISGIPGLWNTTKQRNVASFSSDLLEIGGGFDEEEILKYFCKGFLLATYFKGTQLRESAAP
ncbi:hypothetical protein SCHPADRAFT_930679 [Schizopora paradoxa]|uniref:F-box domain-containing protein n=1 Tax=Schizopora paradoxa TaxID=27342 RepID=A0A0H2RZI5_9AGAM|nr:hypothetical protein SCHPADRAFT_930679 [Schizopora paradoxa]